MIWLAFHLHRLPVYIANMRCIIFWQSNKMHLQISRAFGKQYQYFPRHNFLSLVLNQYYLWKNTHKSLLSEATLFSRKRNYGYILKSAFCLKTNYTVAVKLLVLESLVFCWEQRHAAICSSRTALEMPWPWFIQGVEHFHLS